MDKAKSRARSALIFRLLGLILGISAITVHMLVNSVLTSGFMVKHNLAYFTLQTNIFSTLIFAYLFFKGIAAARRRDYEIPRINHSLHTACTYFISVTMLGFWLLLVPVSGIGKNPWLMADSLLLHLFMPLWAIADFILFAPHGGLKKKELLKWLIYPVCYLISVVIISKFITEPYYTLEIAGESIALMYPYPFLDPQLLGAGGFAAVVAALVIAFSLIGLFWIWLDNRMRKK